MEKNMEHSSKLSISCKDSWTQKRISNNGGGIRLLMNIHSRFILSLLPRCLAQYLIYFVSLTERDSIYCVRTFFIRVKVFLQRGSDSFVNDTLKLQPTRHRRNQSRWHLTTPPIIMLLICLYQWSIWSNSLILPRSWFQNTYIIYSHLALSNSSVDYEWYR